MERVESIRTKSKNGTVDPKYGEEDLASASQAHK